MPVNEGNEGSLTVAAPSEEPVKVTPTLPPGSTPGVMNFEGGLGLHGRARFEAQHNEVQFLGSADDYKNWILSLKEDPTDLEYNLALREAKAKAGQPTVAPSAPDGVLAFPPAPGIVTHMGTRRQKDPDSSEGDIENVLKDEALPTDEEQIKQQKDWRRAADNYKTPVFRGRPVNSDDLYAPEEAQDPFLDDWLSEQGVKLDANSRKKALKSGQYVYMGQEYNEKLGVSRDVYVYKDDAGAASQSIEAGVISNYQKELGLTVTGRMDPYLQPIWEEAVKFAQDSARNGQKISVREWFDLFVQSAIAKKKAGGAGGGGAAAPEEFDYYRGMMQILGDISGVGG